MSRQPHHGRKVSLGLLAVTSIAALGIASPSVASASVVTPRMSSAITLTSPNSAQIGYTGASQFFQLPGNQVLVAATATGGAGGSNGGVGSRVTASLSTAGLKPISGEMVYFGIGGQGGDGSGLGYGGGGGSTIVRMDSSPTAQIVAGGGGGGAGSAVGGAGSYEHTGAGGWGAVEQFAQGYGVGGPGGNWHGDGDGGVQTGWGGGHSSGTSGLTGVGGGGASGSDQCPEVISEGGQPGGPGGQASPADGCAAGGGGAGYGGGAGGDYNAAGGAGGSFAAPLPATDAAATFSPAGQQGNGAATLEWLTSPTVNSAIPTGANSAQVTWTEPSYQPTDQGNVTYQVYVDGVPTANPITGSTFSVNGLAAGKTSSIQIYATSTLNGKTTMQAASNVISVTPTS